MVVYWDSVLLFNGICDYLLLLCTVRVAGRSPQRLHLFFASALGAIYALAVCVYKQCIFCFPLVLVVMGFLAFRKSGEVKKLTLLFSLLACLLAGVLILLSRFGSFSFKRLPWRVFTVAFLLCYFVVGVLFRGGMQKTGQNLIKATFYHRGHKVTLRLLCDNGNMLQDESGVSVPIVEKKAIQLLGVLPSEYTEILCQTVGGKTVLYAFVCDRVEIGKTVRNHCKVAVTTQEIGGIYAGLWCEEIAREDMGAAL